MRILIVAPLLPQADGAGAIPVVLHAQLEALAARNDLTLVVGVGDEPGEAAAAQAVLGTGIDAHFVDRRQPAAARARWRRRWQLASDWLGGGRPWRAVWLGTPGVQQMLDQLSASRSFDLVVVEDSSMASVRLPSGVPSLLTEHEVRLPRAVDWHPGAAAQWPAWAFHELDWRRWESFQRRVWQLYGRIQVFSERDARAIERLAPEVASRVTINPFGIVMPPVADPAQEQPGTVLFTGNFTHAPNRDAAVWLVREIMPLVRTSYPGARLRIVGSSPGKLRALAGEYVELVADAPSVTPYLETASVVLAPVRIGGGMRMKVLQALASGKTVVTTSRGAEGFTAAGDEPPLIVCDDAEGIAAATAELLGDASRRHELGRRARRFAEQQHSPEAWGARLQAVYEEAARGERFPSQGTCFAS